MLPASLSASAYQPARAIAELDFQGPIQQGANGPAARRAQEWLSLHGHGLSIDGDFGPASGKATGDFQAANGIAATGAVDQITWDALVAPMVSALAPLPAEGQTLSALVSEYAAQHVAARPLEVGGENRGPWVRLYLGWDGFSAKWCAGFACFALEQAAHLLAAAEPIASSAACTTLAEHAKAAGRFVQGASVAGAPDLVPAGSFFLVQKVPGVWEHTGIVSAAADDHFATFEGNTDTDGSSNGYEAAARTRGYPGKDFIVW